jgi:hypothetical protein
MQSSDAVCVLLTYFTRYQGLLRRALPGRFCKPNQVLVSLAHSSLFDENALADALTEGRMAAAWFDSLEPGAAGPRPAAAPHRHLQVTPRVASTTLESRVRSAWAWRGASTTCCSHRAAAARLQADAGQASQLVLQAGQRLLEVVQAGALLCHHRGRRAGHEALVAQLGLGLGDLALQPGDFLAQAARLGGHVDLHVQGQAQAALHGHRRACVAARRRPRRRAAAPRPAWPAPAAAGGGVDEGGIAHRQQGTRSPGDRPISLRRRRHGGHHGLQAAIQASAAGSTLSSCACG